MKARRKRNQARLENMKVARDKLRQDQAAVATAKNNLERSQNLVSKGGQQYVSKQDLDNLKNTLDQANAAVAADQGSIRASQVQLGFTKVIAPITGLAGIRAVDVICPGFSVDCLETLEEIALEGRQTFIGAGGREFHAIACLNGDPVWLDALAGLVDEQLAGWTPRHASPDSHQRACQIAAGAPAAAPALEVS